MDKLKPMSEEQEKLLKELNAVLKRMEESGLIILKDPDEGTVALYNRIGWAGYDSKLGAVIMLPF